MLRVNPFADDQGRARRLRGVAIFSGSPRLAELAGTIGFEAVWVEMEHGPTDYTQAEAICMAAEAAGAVPVIRTANGQREHVLKALEVGAQIVVVPMVESAAQAAAIVTAGKFPPLGKRGYNSRSRGLRYGLKTPPENFAEANARTQLFAQIESIKAVEAAAEMCKADGLSGIFIGPGDLSADMGRPGEFTARELIEMVVNVTKTAVAAGKHAGILAAPGPLLTAAIKAGADLVFVGGDYGDLATSWAKLLASVEGG